MTARRALLIALAIAAASWGARAALGLQPGLNAEYFTNAARAGTPAFTAVDADLSTAQISTRWSDAPPDVFGVRWRGYLIAGRADTYTFATTSDDGSWLTVDGHLVVDNGGQHEAVTREGQIRLERGAHFVVVDFAQTGGPFLFEWSWRPAAAAASAVPSWALSPRKVSVAIALTGRALELVWWLAIAGVVIAAIAAVAPMVERPPAIVRRRPGVASLALFVALAVVHTWPLASNPAHLSRNDNADTMLNTWTVAWVAHQAVRDPRHLFDGNIFYPEKRTLAYSESLIAQAAMGAPLLWLGASPVLVYNLLLIAGFALSGWAMCLVLARWTGDWMAALTGGMLMGFNAHTLTRMPHLQAQHAEFLPLALFALDRVLVEPGARRALALAGWFVLQALTSFYLLVFTSISMVGAALVRPRDWTGPRARAVIPSLALAAAAAVAAVLPFLLPYWRLSQDQGFSRGLADAAAYAATWQDYLTTPGRVPRLLLAPWTTTNALYPGAVGVALAIVAIASGAALRDPRARMLLAVGVCGVVLSFGPQVPGYALLYRAFPPLQGIRAAGRFGFLGIVGVAALAGYGVVRVRAWMAGKPWAPAGLVAIVALAAVEPLATPIRYRDFDRIPAIYERLADVPDAVVAELPMPTPRGPFFNASYMLNSTRHWKPLVNGYSGFVPASYVEHYERLRPFPVGGSIEALQGMGVTHVFVHRASLGAARTAELDTSGLRRIAEDRDIVLYEIPRAPRP